MDNRIKNGKSIISNVHTDSDVDAAVKALADNFDGCDPNDVASFIVDELEGLSKKTDELLHAVSIQKQLEDYKEILPMAYIARTYFGKTAAWLHQRINGNPVRGKVYSLKPNEIEILNNAIHDIGAKLGSLSVQGC